MAAGCGTVNIGMIPLNKGGGTGGARGAIAPPLFTDLKKIKIKPCWLAKLSDLKHTHTELTVIMIRTLYSYL